MQGVSKRAWLTLAGVLLLPLVSMWIVPFFDTSEPRYAEIARIMAQSGDWITPWLSPGVPFWGKPPLSFWAQAASMRLFGYTEFAARLPAWICLLLSNVVLLRGLAILKGPRIAMMTAIIYSTCSLVYISSGAVLTDPFLALGTTLSLISFAVLAGTRLRDSGTGDPAASSGQPAGQASLSGWRYGFFVGLAIGLLAKGPLAAVVVFAPVVIWRVCTWRSGLSAGLPWGKGLVLTAALSLPWYVLAEIRTPGFLDYFIIGEHVRRFLDPGWTGDLYGTAHQRPYGAIWLGWLEASFPWGLLVLGAVLGALCSVRIRGALRNLVQDPLLAYWLAAMLFTPVFLTFSANILWTYLLPALAGMSVLVALFLHEIESRFDGPGKKLLTAVPAIVPACVLLFSVIVSVDPDLRNTERGLVRYAMQSQSASQPSSPLLYFSKPPFSARFYSAGRVQEVTPGTFQRTSPYYLAVPRKQQEDVADLLGKPLDPVYTNKRYLLVKVSPDQRPSCPMDACSSRPDVLAMKDLPSGQRMTVTP